MPRGRTILTFGGPRRKVGALCAKTGSWRRKGCERHWADAMRGGRRVQSTKRLSRSRCLRRCDAQCIYRSKLTGLSVAQPAVTHIIRIAVCNGPLPH